MPDMALTDIFAVVYIERVELFVGKDTDLILRFHGAAHDFDR